MKNRLKTGARFLCPESGQPSKSKIKNRSSSKRSLFQSNSKQFKDEILNMQFTISDYIRVDSSNFFCGPQRFCGPTPRKCPTQSNLVQPSPVPPSYKPLHSTPVVRSCAARRVRIWHLGIPSWHPILFP